MASQIFKPQDLHQYCIGFRCTCAARLSLCTAKCEVCTSRHCSCPGHLGSSQAVHAASRHESFATKGFCPDLVGPTKQHVLQEAARAAALADLLRERAALQAGDEAGKEALATLQAKLDAMSARKHGLVLQLKQAQAGYLVWTCGGLRMSFLDCPRTLLHWSFEQLAKEIC